MASTPRGNIVDDVIQGLRCAICGEDALHIVHIERLPDYVECMECKSAFIMEDGGDRVLYGQIADGFPQTSHFALKQWAWIEAVDTRAREERPTPDEDLLPDSITTEEPQPEEYPPDEIDSSVEPDQDFKRDEWAILDEPAPIESIEPSDIEEPAPSSEEQVTPVLEDFPEPAAVQPESIASDLPSEELEDESLESEEVPEAWQAYDAVTASEEQPVAEESSDVLGFDWLGGLADEDSPFEEPEFPDFQELPIDEETPARITEPEVGLSSEDLDNLFRSESVEDAVTPVFDEEDEGEFPGATDFDESLDWEAEETTFEDSTSKDEEQPPSEWLQDKEEVDSEPAFAEFEPSEEGLSIADEDYSDDFLSSLRDSAAIPLESQPYQDPSIDEIDQDLGEPEPPSWAVEEQDVEIGAMAARMQSVTSAPEAQAPETVAEQEPEGEEVAQEPIQPDVIHYRETDPPPGYRHRVVISGERVIFPGGECVHCGQTPVKGQLAIAGTLPEGQVMGDRKPTRFQVPLCAECRQRATSLSEDARSARIQSLLISGIIGMAFVVGALALSIVDSGAMQLVDWLTLIILFVIGFAGSAILLLNRISNYPPPMDAAYVRTTLLIPSETQGLETAFEWRNEDYAGRFYEANQANALGNVTRVKDRLILGGS
jgi:hypothetical protein